MTLPSHTHKEVRKKRRSSASGRRFTNSATFIRALGDDDDDLAQVSLTSAERAEQAKYSGHLIYNSIHGNNNVVPPPAAATNPPPPPLPQVGSSSETPAMDGLEEDGKMSSVRRTFCLYTLFDLGLMFILWVIYTQLIGEPGYKAFEDQMLSAVRMTILLLAYGLYRLSRCWVVGFEGTKSNNNPLSYCLIIISFVLSWSETWFVDFKILPTERKMKFKAIDKYGRGYGSFAGGRGLRSDDLRSIMTEDNTFYSPLDSPDGYTFSGRSRDKYECQLLSQAEGTDNDYIRLAKHSVEVLWTYLRSPETEWKLEKGTSVEEGLVHSKKVQGVGKVFRLKCYIDIPRQELYDYINTKPEEQTDWNATVKECRVLQVVDDHSDILYIVSNELGGGAIQSRDFVSLRSWVEKNGILLSAGMSVKHPDMPTQKNYIRGLDSSVGRGLAPWPRGRRFEPQPSTVQPLLGWFPQKLIDANLASVLVDFHRDITKQAKKLTSVPGEATLAQNHQSRSAS
ncbi:StAR-related lipid transfer protein 3 [Elysia marginata]|uniref:StAR-related lipid transfer protein 3 n=1 Tax=Elysia marginata TaxID=1093978 RepID=A0AAV4GG34_9GAST|nr:StAR-related lipid transfer protein 3 [Elysia marginata]